MGSETRVSESSVYQSEAERTWVERFVSHGGTAADAIAAYRRISRPPVAPPPRHAPSQLPLLSITRLPALPSGTESAPIPAARPSQSLPPSPVIYDQAELDLSPLEHQALIDADAPDPAQAIEMGFVTAAMVFAALPHRAVKGPVYKRRKGQTTLTIMNDPDIGIPYGRYPRLLLAHICTLAKRTGERRLHLGDTQAEFLRRLGLNNDGGGARGQMGILKERTIQLLTSSIRLQNDSDSKFSFVNLQFADQGSLIWTPHNQQDGVQQFKWQGFIDLSTPFFEQCTNHSFPIDLSVIKQFQSSLAIDIYIWLTYRMNNLTKPLRISWEQLQFQFGSEYQNNSRFAIHNFKASFCAQLNKVLMAYKYANVSVHPNHIELKPSDTHIPRSIR